MRSRRSSQDHDAAVARRLEQLRAELEATRDGRSATPAVEPFVEPFVEPAAGGEWWEGHTRVATQRRPLVVVPPLEPVPVPAPAPASGPRAPEEVPSVPVPGRHAARRRRPGLAAALPDALPDTLRGRVGLGVAQVAVLAVAVAVGLAATTWWVLRGDAEVAPTAAPLVAPAGTAIVALPSASPSVPAPDTGGAAPTTVTVDVAGKVRRPGIAVLDAGSRVVDALEAAGGARPGVDLSSINLARLLVDGEQILVGRSAAPGVPGLPSGTVPGEPGPLVNLNLAGQAELETLPEVGPVTALAILAWRDDNGGFSSVEELLEVDGIGDATLEQIAPFVTI